MKKITKQDIQNELDRRALAEKEKEIRKLKDLSIEELNKLLNEN